jgi:hypothetical protein
MLQMMREANQIMSQSRHAVIASPVFKVPRTITNSHSSQ